MGALRGAPGGHVSAHPPGEAGAPGPHSPALTPALTWAPVCTHTAPHSAQAHTLVAHSCHAHTAALELRVHRLTFGLVPGSVQPRGPTAARKLGETLPLSPTRSARAPACPPPQLRHQEGRGGGKGPPRFCPLWNALTPAPSLIPAGHSWDRGPLAAEPARAHQGRLGGVGWGGGPRLQVPSGQTGPQKARAGVVSPPPSPPPSLDQTGGFGALGAEAGLGQPQGVLPLGERLVPGCPRISRS